MWSSLCSLQMGTQVPQFIPKTEVKAKGSPASKAHSCSVTAQHELVQPEVICLLLSKSPKRMEGKRAPLGLTTRALSRTLPDLKHLQVALSVKHKLLAMYSKCMFKATI